MLEVLARRPGVVRDQADTCSRRSGQGAVDGHAVEVTVGRLRRRLGGTLDIRTVPRRGYSLLAPTAGQQHGLNQHGLNQHGPSRSTQKSSSIENSPSTPVW